MGSEHEEVPAGAGRRRGRHAAPAAAGDATGRAAVLGAWFARAAAEVEPRRAAAAAWLSKRRLPVFIAAATVATLALLGGTVAVLQLTRAPQQTDDAAPAVSTVRPTSSDGTYPNTFAPILPTPGTPTPLPPLHEPADPEGPDATPTDAVPVPEPEPQPTTEPDGNGRDTAPGQTKKPDKPGG